MVMVDEGAVIKGLRLRADNLRSEIKSANSTIQALVREIQVREERIRNKNIKIETRKIELELLVRKIEEMEKRWEV